MKYYPPRGSKGLWKMPQDKLDYKKKCGMNYDKLMWVIHKHRWLNGGDTFGCVIIRNGYMVCEFYSENALVQSTYDVFSCTKSFTSIAIGILINNMQKDGKSISIDSKAYDYIPQGYPLSDKKKESITIKNLLSMTSGLIGEQNGVIGMGMASNDGHFEYALGFNKNRFGKSCAKLIFEPGYGWDYSDANYVHLSLLYHNLTNSEIHEFMKRNVFDKIGLENYYWDLQGCCGNIGPHTNGHSGFHINARGLARFGYLLLNHGIWEGKEVIPRDWIEKTTVPSQDYNPNYGMGFWVNTTGECLPGLPKDLYYMMGYRSNRCYIIPSLNMVIAHTATGPSNWDERILVEGIISSIIT